MRAFASRGGVWTEKIGFFKTYVGRPETDWARGCAMNLLGNGLFAAQHGEDAVSVREAELSLRRRLGASERNLLAVPPSATWFRPRHCSTIPTHAFGVLWVMGIRIHRESINVFWKSAGCWPAPASARSAPARRRTPNYSIRETQE